jgi:hypothetical protein
MKNHTELLNFLISNFNLKTYCEIGVQFKRANFNLINISDENKTGVDPDPNAEATYQMTSDSYFNRCLARPHDDPKSHFDLYFIDGLHHADQVERDFRHAMTYLNDGGIIMLHDCNPAQEIHSIVPRNGLRGIWTGDVYKFICCLNNYEGIDFRTVDFDNGCCIVWKTNYYDYKKGQPKDPALDIKTINWNFLQRNKHLLRLIAPNEETILNQIAITYGK